MPVFYRHRDEHLPTNIIAVRIFALPEGIACVVSWPLPEPGLRVFSPSATKPEGMAEALPYAQFIAGHLGVPRITVEMDDGIEWQPAWGELRDWVDG